MRFGLGFAAVAAVACSEGGVKSVNATPEAYITSHATGDTVREADTETVLGQVADEFGDHIKVVRITKARDFTDATLIWQTKELIKNLKVAKTSLR